MIKTAIDFKNGIHLELVEGYPLCQQWYNSNEPETKDWICDHVRPDWTVFDLGAHVGVYTLLLSLLTPYGQVFAFEPCELSRKMIAGNIAHSDGLRGHHFTNIQLSPLAVGNISGQGLMETLWLTDGSNTYGKTTSRFDFITLDDFCKANDSINRLDFIKCDVDGWDYDVLVGAEKVLQKFRPFLIIEVSPYAISWRGHTAYDIDKLLKKNDYLHKVIDPTPGQWLCWPAEIIPDWD